MEDSTILKIVIWYFFDFTLFMIKKNNSTFTLVSRFIENKNYKFNIGKCFF